MNKETGIDQGYTIESFETEECKIAYGVKRTDDGVWTVSTVSNREDELSFEVTYGPLTNSYSVVGSDSFGEFITKHQAIHRVLLEEFSDNLARDVTRLHSKLALCSLKTQILEAKDSRKSGQADSEDLPGNLLMDLVYAVLS